ncbi:uncharacterized protein LOC112591976 [Melanaphis sacchari]|uniref:uncharacterized protein LOC112591976 n=1 Tax=Melanaphis sacchari TaxID=742174 RepID=UPI000DC14762|nr:uncharacterized protein LOC112591976 [Melanaphis sacchari]
MYGDTVSGYSGYAQIIDEKRRLSIIDLYKTYLPKHPGLPLYKLVKKIADSMGIGKTTVGNVIKEYNESKTVTIPKRKRAKKSFLDTFDDFDKNAVRGHVHKIWFTRQIPTVDKIHQSVSADINLPPISRTNLFRLLKALDFRYTKRSRNSALTEKNELVEWRRRYLRDIERYRKEGRHIYYLDETWVNVNERSSKTRVNTTIKSDSKELSTSTANPSGKTLIVLDIGSEKGFVPDALLCFESKNNTSDYHDEINEKIFRKWMEGVLPRLKSNSVVVMDNASYHCEKVDNAPSSDTPKADIIKWLTDKGVVIDKPIVIPELLQIVKRIKPQHEKYVIDELAKSHNHTILRLPPYHCELNPIKLAWSSVKKHVRTKNINCKLPIVKKLIKQGVNRVNSTMWKNFIQQTKDEEKKLYDIDFIIDEVLTAETSETVLTITGDTTSNSDSDSD